MQLTLPILLTGFLVASESISPSEVVSAYHHDGSRGSFRHY